MTVYPPAPLVWQNSLALDFTHSQISYVGYEGTIFHLSGPFSPVLGAQSGVVIKDIARLDPAFKHLDNKGARQDGTTWYDTLYDAAEIDFNVVLGGINAADTRNVIRAWMGAWDPKQLGKLCWFSPERGEWWANVRLMKSIPNNFQYDWYQAREVAFTWSCRNDMAFWQGVDSVCTFSPNAQQILSITGGPTGGTFTLTLGGHTTPALTYNIDANELTTALESLTGIGPNNVLVQALDGSGASFLIQFINDLGAATVATLSAISSLTGGSVGVSVTPLVDGTTSASGFVNLSNIGDQPGWPRYLLYGPGTFTIGDVGTPNSITFGPLLAGQVVLLNALPRLPAVVDLSPTPSATTTTQQNQFASLLSDLINFVTNNNIPPFLQEFESLFGILPPQGNLYSLLKGRFTQAIPPMLEQVGPVTTSIPVSITGATAASQIIAAVTPQRRWPE